MNIGDMLRRLLYTEPDRLAPAGRQASGAVADMLDLEKPSPAFRALIDRVWRALGEQRSVLSGNLHMVGLHTWRTLA